MINVGIHTFVDGVKSATEREWGGGFVGGEQRGEEAVVDFGVEEGYADALGGEEIGVRIWDPSDESVETKAPQVIRHLGGGVGGAEEVADEGRGSTGDQHEIGAAAAAVSELGHRPPCSPE